MSEGEHTVISKIPRERLNQIAGRRLAALSIPVRLGADRETLEGELPLSAKVLNPATGQPLGRACFAVEGHDHLRFLDPPLAALAPVSFYDCERAAAVEQRVGEALAARLALLQSQAAQLRALRLEVTADPERLAARAVVKTPTHAFELRGGADGIRVTRLAPVGGKPIDIPASHPPIRLEEHATASDLEIALARAVPELEAAARAGARRPGSGLEAGVARLESAAPPRNALTLGQVLRAFGEGATLGPGAPFEVVQEFQLGDTRYRFAAVQEVGTMFRARLIGPRGDVWSDRFDLAHFPGTGQMVAAALGLPADAAPDAASGRPAGEGGGVVPQHLLPRAGEIWVMGVVVESQGPEDVRYVGTDIDGRPYGAARVLKRADFEAVFTPRGGGWRLLVRVDQVQGDHLLYRQLDLQRQPLGAPRRMATAVLVANFVPEAAAF